MSRKLLIVSLFCVAALHARAQMYVKEILNGKIPIAYEGKAVDAYEYHDKAGLHVYLVTKVETDKQTNLFGCAYTQVNGTFVKDWEIKDFGDGIWIHYPDTRIVDIDGDGVYETIFVYHLDDDPNPKAMAGGQLWKAMLHYKNHKYVMRIHVPDLDDDEYSVTTDKIFDTLPKMVRKYMVDYWNKVAEEEKLKGRYEFK